MDIFLIRMISMTTNTEFVQNWMDLPIMMLNSFKHSKKCAIFISFIPNYRQVVSVVFFVA